MQADQIIDSIERLLRERQVGEKDNRDPEIKNLLKQLATIVGDDNKQYQLYQALFIEALDGKRITVPDRAAPASLPDPAAPLAAQPLATPPPQVSPQAAAPTTPPAMSPAPSSLERADPAKKARFSDFKESGAFGAALLELDKLNRFSAVEELLTGDYSTGYAAMDKNYPAGRVVIKIPAKSQWETRFDTCADALRSEAAILKQVNDLVATKQLAPEPDGCARIIQHIGAGSVSVGSLNVPYVIQSFAHGDRLIGATTLPLRGEREEIGVRVLLQVIGMVAKLYEHNLAHLDLKHDCLFWDDSTKLVEVIDWNTARLNPDNAALDREFTGLQKLTRDLFLGPNFDWNPQHSNTQKLFVTLRGTPLSRGVRLLIWRLHEPTLPNALKSVADLHAAVRDLHRIWEQPLSQLPDLSDTKPETLSAALSTVAIELQRPRSQTVNNADHTKWHDTITEIARKTVRGELGFWVNSPQNMRASFPNIEQLFAWLPDTWPIVWLMPFIRDWLRNQDRAMDGQLKDPIQAVVNHQAAALADWKGRMAAQLTPALQASLQAIEEALAAYASLNAAANYYNEGKNNDALGLLNTLRQQLPLERRLQQLDESVTAKSDHIRRIRDLKKDLDSQDQLVPSLDKHQQIWNLVNQLQTLGQAEPRFEQLKTLDATLKNAQAARDRAEQYALFRQWELATGVLDHWITDKTVATHAPDLAKIIEERHQEYALQQAVNPLEATLTLASQALATGDFDQADRALQIAEHQASALTETKPELIKLVRESWDGIVAIKLLVTLVGQGEYTKALPPPTTPVGIARFEIEMLQQVVGKGVEFQKAQLFSDKASIWQDAHRQASQPASALLISTAWRTLADSLFETLEQIVEAELTTPDQARLKHVLDGVLAHQYGLKMAAAAASIQDKASQLQNETNQGIQAIYRESQTVTSQVSTLTGEMQSAHGRFDQVNQHLTTLTAQVTALNEKSVEKDQKSAADKAAATQPGNQQRGTKPQTVKPRDGSSTHNDPMGLTTQAPSDAQIPPKSRKQPMMLAAGLLSLALLAAFVFLVLPKINDPVATNLTTTPSSGTVTVGQGSTTHTVTPTKPSSGGSPTDTPATPVPDDSDSTTSGGVYPLPAPTEPTTDATPSTGVSIEFDKNVPVVIGRPITFTAPGLDSVTAVTVTFPGIAENQVITSTRIISDQLTVTVPITMLNQIPDEQRWPAEMVLSFGDQFAPVVLPMAEVRTVVAGAAPTTELADDGRGYIDPGSSEVLGFFIGPDSTVMNEDNYRTKAIRGESTEYVLINNGDEIIITEQQSDMFKVKVKTNSADALKLDLVLDKEGWILKSLIIGP